MKVFVLGSCRLHRPMEEIAAHVRSMVEKGRWTPRIDRLPYYAAPVRAR